MRPLKYADGSRFELPGIISQKCVQLAVEHSMSAVTWLAFGGLIALGIPTDLTLASDLAFVFNANWMSLGHSSARWTVACSTK